MKRTIPERICKLVVGYVLEISVLVAINIHLYELDGKVYLQQIGGPIGMRFTAYLTVDFMNLWDMAWMESMETEGLLIEMYMRYVDDSWNML